MELHPARPQQLGGRGEASLSEQIELATKATPHRGAEQSTNHTQCATAERISGHPACSVLPHCLPRPWEDQVPSEVQVAHGVWHQKAVWNWGSHTQSLGQEALARPEGVWLLELTRRNVPLFSHML